MERGRAVPLRVKWTGEIRGGTHTTSPGSTEDERSGGGNRRLLFNYQLKCPNPLFFIFFFLKFFFTQIFAKSIFDIKTIKILKNFFFLNPIILNLIIFFFKTLQVLRYTGRQLQCVHSKTKCDKSHQTAEMNRSVRFFHMANSYLTISRKKKN